MERHLCQRLLSYLNFADFGCFAHVYQPWQAYMADIRLVGCDGHAPTVKSKDDDVHVLLACVFVMCLHW